MSLLNFRAHAAEVLSPNTHTQCGHQGTPPRAPWRVSSVASPDALGQSSSGEKEPFLYLEELDSLLRELQSVIPAKRLGIPGGCQPRVLLRCSRDALRAGGPCEPLLPPASSPQVPSGGGLSGSWLTGFRSRVDEGKGHRKVPELPRHLRQMLAGEDAGRESEGP